MIDIHLHTCLHCNFRALITQSSCNCKTIVYTLLTCGIQQNTTTIPHSYNSLAIDYTLLTPRKLKVKCNSLCKSHHSCKKREYIITNTAKNIQLSCSCNTICKRVVNTTIHINIVEYNDHTTTIPHVYNSLATVRQLLTRELQLQRSCKTILQKKKLITLTCTCAYTYTYTRTYTYIHTCIYTYTYTSVITTQC